MPHVVVKLWPGKTEQQKMELAAAITRNLMDILGSSESSVSIAMEEVPSDAWKAAVYDPEIEAKADQLYKKPGYTLD